jgi:hypothetical protein
MVREVGAYLSDHLEESLDISVRYIQTDEGELIHESCLCHLGKLLEVGIAYTESIGDIVRIIKSLEKLSILIERIVLVEGGYNLVLCECVTRGEVST